MSVVTNLIFSYSILEDGSNIKLINDWLTDKYFSSFSDEGEHAWAISKQSILTHVNKPNTPVTKKGNTGTMTIKAMLLGHKMKKTPGGRVYCDVCNRMVTEITRGQLKCQNNA